jgi:peptide/nickel transport system substrate-binding protein
LRDGIKYSTGGSVRASDFILGLKRVLTNNGGNPGYYSGIIGGQNCIDHPTRCDVSRGLTADDAAGTLTFHLVAPEPEFLYKLTYFLYPTPPGTPLAESRTPLPGTGPYMISGHTEKMVDGIRRSLDFTLVRNPYFRQWSFAAQPAGYPDKIQWRRVTGAAQGSAQVIASQADVAYLQNFPKSVPMPSGFVDDLAHRYPTLFHSQLRPVTDWEALNTRVPPFNNRLARRAVNYAVDRRTFIESATSADVTCQILPPDFPGYRPYCPYTTGDPRGPYNGPALKTARALVIASGTLGTPVRVLSLDNPDDHRSSLFFVNVLNQIGYQASLYQLPTNPDNAGKQADPRNRIQVGSSGWGADYPDPGNFYFPLFSCASFIPNSGDNTNVSEYCNPSLDALAKHATEIQPTNPSQAVQTWARIDQMLTDDAPAVAMETPRSFVITSSRLGNYQSNPYDGPILSQMWVR